MSIVGISAIDGALWELLGKASGLPIYRLLGGHHQTVPAYHSGGLWLSSSADDLTREAQDSVGQGFQAMHGYSHENPIAMTPEQEEAVLDRSIELITELSGRRPTGYVAPWWEFSPVSNELLIKKGIKYDHSLMHKDFHPYYVRVGDTWTKIDYSKHPSTWMKPLVRGQETSLVEIPASWYLDDLPPMMFVKKSPNSHADQRAD